MIAALLNRALGWKACAAAAVVTLVFGAAAGWTVRDWRAGAERAARAEERVRVVERVLYRERAQDDATDRIEAAAVAAQAEIRTITRTLIEKAPVHVTPTADRRCHVPVGLVRLHDAAAAGEPVPEPAGQPDDAPSGLALSAVAATVVDNYGSCRSVARQLTDLQAWVRAQQAVAEGQTAPAPDG